jgi:hypothetical protein
MLLLFLTECSECRMGLAGPALAAMWLRIIIIIIIIIIILIIIIIIIIIFYFLKGDRLLNLCVNTVILFQLQSTS